MHTATMSIERDRNDVSIGKQLIQKIRADEELPALGAAISQVVRLASSGDEAVGDLARYILSDVALTQNILRLANTVTYRTSSSAPVTTVSRAIFLLGFDTVASSALAMLLVDALADRKHAHSIYAELGAAMLASAIGRELARRSHYKDAEEAAIAALFKNLGRILVASHEHKAYAEIQDLERVAHSSQVKAAIEVLGCSFDMLALAVLKEWRIPESIVAALVPLGAAKPRPAKQRHEWLQQVVEFSAEAASIATAAIDMESAPAQSLLARYSDALSLDSETLSTVLQIGVRETRALMNGMAQWIDMPAHERLQTVASPAIPVELLLAESSLMPSRITDRHPSGKPVNARDLLLEGMQEVMHTMASSRCKVNDLMLLVLETLSRSLGFRFAVVCLKDSNSNQFRARIAIGEQHRERQSGFTFALSATNSRDLFQLALCKDVDLLISDSADPKISGLIPAWHRGLLPDARSFIILPLVVQQKPIGFFYADRALPAPEGVPADETSLIKTLKGQVSFAMQRPR